MHPALIKAALEIANTTQADVSRQCDVSPALVYDVIQGNRHSKTVENRIAVITQLPLAKLWPARYGPGAKTRSRKQSPSSIAAALDQLAHLPEAS